MSVFPIELVRSQFPALSGDAVFLDNPAGTQVPRQVINAVAEAMAGAASNIGGAFRASKSARDIWTRAHDATAELLGGKSGREVILGQSMTMLTFHISRTLGRTWAPGDEIILTRMDHDANVAPWLQMAEDRGLIVRWLPFNRDSWRIEPQDLEPLLSPRTRLLAVNYASNLTGSINPVAELTRLAKEAGALVYVDAVQLVPHVKADVDAIGCDFLACSSYKFFGPHLGVLWGREALLDELNPYAVRCAPSDLPGRLELGTPQTELFAGLAATADYFVWLGEQVGCSGSRESKIKAAYAAATANEMPIAQRLIDGLANIEGVRLQGISDSRMLSHRVPTVSFTHARQRNSMLAKALATKGINVWSGHNYALEVVRHLGLDEQEGVLRIGLAHYNTVKEVDVIIGLLEALLAGG
jgi:cysteine desulfurase family protein (TIGR01976 family)